MSHQWTEDMGEISGMGGSYEAGCRAMVLAGIDWIDQHPDADLKFASFKDVFGVVIEKSADAQALTDAIMNARCTMEDGKEVRCGDEATGAMHHAAINHVMAYKRLGWEAYQNELREREKTEGDK